MSIQPIRKQSLHENLLGQLRDLVLSKQSGDRLEPETVLAKRADVSIVTLRNAMLVLEREGFIERTAGRGTFVKTPPPKISTEGHIAIYCGAEVFRPRPSYHFLGAISALRQFFTKQNLMTQIYFSHPEIKKHQLEGTMVESTDICPEFSQAIASGQVKGAVFLAGQPDSAWAQAMRVGGIPVVGSEEFGVGVTTDNNELGRRGVRQLVSHGCRRLALLGWGSRAGALVNGFRDEVQSSGLTLNEAWIRHDLNPEDSGAGWEEFREIWTSGVEKPDGLIVTDDILFADAVRAMAELGINVPANLQIVSHANRDAYYPAPFPVDWLENDPTEHGHTMGSQLLKLLRGEVPEPSVILLPHRLVTSNGTRRQGRGAATDAVDTGHFETIQK